MHCIHKIIYSAAVLLLPFSLAAQDVSTGCGAASEAFFLSEADSLACLHFFVYLDTLEARVVSDGSAENISAYEMAGDSLLQMITRSLTDTLHSFYIEALDYTAQAVRFNNPEKATALLERAVSLLHALYPECKSEWSGRMYSHLASQYDINNRLEEADQYYNVSIDILSNLSQPPSAFIAEQYMHLGFIEYSADHQATASAQFQKAAHWHIIAGDTVSAAKAIGWQAYALYQAYDYQTAEQAYQQTVNLLQSSLGKQSEQTIMAQQDLVTFYNTLARFDDAYKLSRDILTTLTRPGAAYDPALTFSTYTSIANLTAKFGNYAEAETFYRKANQIAEQMPKEDYPRYISLANNNTAVFMAARGRSDEAIQLLEHTMQMLDTSVSTRVKTLKSSLAGNLATLYSRLGQYKEAESLLMFALSTDRQTFGENSKEIIEPLNNLGVLFRDIGNYTEAFSYIHRALTLSETIFGADHPRYGRTLNNLASVELAMNHDSAAILHLREAETALQRWYDPWHSEMLECLSIMALWFERHPDDPDAAGTMRLLSDGMTRQLRDSFDFGSEHEQLQLYEGVAVKYLNSIARWACTTKNPAGAEILFDALLQMKGEILAEHARLQRSIRGRQKEADLAKLLYDTRERYASLATRPPDKRMLALRKQLLKEIDSLDAVLRSFSVGYLQRQRSNEANWRDVQRSLRVDEAMIIYHFITSYSKDQAGQLIALVLRTNSPPAIVSLCKENEIHSVFSIPEDEQLLSLLPDIENMTKLSELIWVPFAERLKNIRRCTIVPDGVLHRVAFAALPDSAGSATVLDDSMELLQHISLKGILSRNYNYTRIHDGEATRCVLIGNPDFGHGKTPQQNKKKPGWGPLPGTQTETDSIASLCHSYDIPTLTLQGARATETAVKKLSATDVRVLHIATHGFFFSAPGNNSIVQTDSIEYLRGRESVRIEQHPLLRSGLILANANAAWTGQQINEASDDGILTALEISRLDFSNTELVTLSACETALGDITTGDGVYGLQRSFLIAGASTLVMSLWKVPDRPTAELMRKFYSSWFSGKTIAEALREARALLRQRYRDPRVWAPFVLIEM